MNQVVPLKQLDRAVNALAKKLIQKFPECTRYTRQQLDTWKDLAWTLTAGHARDWLAVHATSWEPYEGVQAFIEKRPADTRNMRERRRRGNPASSCGAPTPRKCADCGAKGIPEKFDYCGKCGSKLKDQGPGQGQGRSRG